MKFFFPKARFLTATLLALSCGLQSIPACAMHRAGGSSSGVREDYPEPASSSSAPPRTLSRPSSLNFQTGSTERTTHSVLMEWLQVGPTDVDAEVNLRLFQGMDEGSLGYQVALASERLLERQQHYVFALKQRHKEWRAKGMEIQKMLPQGNVDPKTLRSHELRNILEQHKKVQEQLNPVLTKLQSLRAQLSEAQEDQVQMEKNIRNFGPRILHQLEEALPARMARAVGVVCEWLETPVENLRARLTVGGGNTTPEQVFAGVMDARGALEENMGWISLTDDQVEKVHVREELLRELLRDALHKMTQQETPGGPPPRIFTGSEIERVKAPLSNIVWVHPREESLVSPALSQLRSLTLDLRVKEFLLTSLHLFPCADTLESLTVQLIFPAFMRIHEALDLPRLESLTFVLPRLTIEDCSADRGVLRNIFEYHTSSLPLLREVVIETPTDLASLQRYVSSQNWVWGSVFNNAFFLPQIIYRSTLAGGGEAVVQRETLAHARRTAVQKLRAEGTVIRHGVFGYLQTYPLRWRTTSEALQLFTQALSIFVDHTDLYVRRLEQAAYIAGQPAREAQRRRIAERRAALGARVLEIEE